MLFTFKRDEEGRERIYVGDVCVWQSRGDMRFNAGAGVHQVPGTTTHKEEFNVVCDAIERADVAGFWAMRDARSFEDITRHLEAGVDAWINDEVTVDVPVADNAVLSVTVGGDES